MGICFGKSKKSKAEIAPCNVLNGTPTVRLYASPNCFLTFYIRFALIHKGVALKFIPSENPDFGSDFPVIQIGSETVSGSRETLLGYIESRFPHPPLMVPGGGIEEMMPWIVRVTILQHKSVKWHLDRMVRWAEDLAMRGGGRVLVDPAVGSPRMEVRKFGKSYSQLLEVMMEHAQMEERVIFPILEMADRGLCKAANEKHARDLPIMNGIKEDIKSIGVIDSGSSVYQEALSSLSSRLKSLRENFKEHFEEEERDLLPYMEAIELSKVQQDTVTEQCLDVMQATHSRLFHFFMEGFLPLEAMEYLDLINTSNNKERTTSMLWTIVP